MTQTGVAGKPIDILLVEDNPGDVRLATEALKTGRIKNQMHVASDGEEAMDFLLRKGEFANAPRPDLVLLDLNLPRKDGREVLAEIKSHPDLRSIPVIILTTSRSEQDILKAYDLHANCYIAKPIDVEQYWAAIRCFEDFWFTVVKLPGRGH
ncbi:MAG: response regulator [Bryobacteraceae bacterium]|nr:response regulator [Bryobacterales bacterium]MEB2361725.1 response regulator [Bryobacterales bacterium]NUN03848.1 response regulator [Bryobacteraceae bacterium]